MSLTILQTMGTASKLMRVMILILVGIICWRLWYYAFPITPSLPPEVQLNGAVIKNVPHQTEKLEVAVASPLRVAVYYEALCPDSRHFVSRQLVPGYDVIGDIISVDLIPYGKAQSQILSDGRKKFRCQHGPQECKANAVHACVSKHVRDERRRMQVVKCMIDLNSRRSDVVQDGKKCVSEWEDEDWSAIEKCSLGEEGEELLFHMGKMTDDLDPKVSFIPTITINDKQDHQALILKNFVKGVCEAYSGPAHSACGT